MGEPKLLMSVGKSTVIERLLLVLHDAGVDQTVVVCRKDDFALRDLLSRMSVTYGRVKIVIPDVDPPDMRCSVQYALDEITSSMRPAESDAWMLIPADHPVLTCETVVQLIAEWKTSRAQIVVPVHNGERGHPTFFGWNTVRQVVAIAQDRGLNELLKDERNTIHEVDVNDPTVLFDLDTPEDYQRMIDQFGD